MLEAITPVKLSLDYLPSCPPEADLIYEWLLELHLVRHPIGAETRLNKLLQLLVNHFGIRQAEGYCLPFMLSHNRLAEMIGTTRSTATRQLNHLKHNGLIAVSKQVNSMSLSTEFMQTMP
ncbi:MAG: hypothetical protein RLZZ336_1907 [Cyanobacteriota bacterium]